MQSPHPSSRKTNRQNCDWYPKFRFDSWWGCRGRICRAGGDLLKEAELFSKERWISGGIRKICTLLYRHGHYFLTKKYRRFFRSWRNFPKICGNLILSASLKFMFGLFFSRAGMHVFRKKGEFGKNKSPNLGRWTRCPTTGSRGYTPI